MSGGTTYFIRFRGVVKGPFDLETLQQLAARRQLTRAHSVSTDGVNWRTAGELGELFGPADRPSVRERLEETARTRRTLRGEHEPALPTGTSSAGTVSTAPHEPATARGLPAADIEEGIHVNGISGRDEVGPLLARIAIGAAAAVLLFLVLPFGVHDGRLQSIVGMARSDDPTDALLLALVLAAGGAALLTAFSSSLLTRGVTWIVAGVAAAIGLTSYPGLPVIGPVVLAQIWFWPALIAGGAIWRWCEPDARPPRVLLIVGGGLLATWAIMLLSLVIGSDLLEYAMAGPDGSAWLPLLALIGLLLAIGSPATLGTLGIVVGSTGGRRGPVRQTVLACGLSSAALALFIVVDAAISLANESPAVLFGAAGRFVEDLAALEVLHATLWTARFCAVLVATALLIGVGFAQLALARAERRVLESRPEAGRDGAAVG